jgi:general secretion pathway protein A
VYERFFGLSEPAFSLAPDPRLLWQSETHEEGLATLLYGITRRKGFLLLTGDVGVGKTTLLRAALEELPRNVAVAFVLNTHELLPDDLLEMVVREFGLRDQLHSRVDRLYAMADFLVDCARHDRNAVLVVDEAQNLSAEALEEVRLLSNFETLSEKLLQIVLCGQPELRQTLELPALRPLRQRIALEHHVEPLVEIEVRSYLAHRIAMAGGHYDDIFKFGAEQLFHAFSRGYPRTLNVLADRVLLAAYARKLRPVPVEFVQEQLESLAKARRLSPR